MTISGPSQGLECPWILGPSQGLGYSIVRLYFQGIKLGCRDGGVNNIAHIGAFIKDAGASHHRIWLMIMLTREKMLAWSPDDGRQPCDRHRSPFWNLSEFLRTAILSIQLLTRHGTFLKIKDQAIERYTYQISVLSLGKYCLTRQQNLCQILSGT